MQYKGYSDSNKINSSHKHTKRETTLDRELQSALGYRDTLLSTQLVTGEVQFISLNYVEKKPNTNV